MHRDVVPIFAEFGAAVHVAQRLEFGLALLLAFAAKFDHARIPRSSVERLYSRQAEQTLGELFGSVRKHEYLTRAEQKTIYKAIRERNTLVHSYLLDKGELMLTPEGRAELLDDLARMQKALLAADEVVESLVDRYLREHDVSVDEITAQWDELWVPSAGAPAAGRRG